jgi:hypothetical protein
MELGIPICFHSVEMRDMQEEAERAKAHYIQCQATADQAERQSKIKQREYEDALKGLTRVRPEVTKPTPKRSKANAKGRGGPHVIVLKKTRDKSTIDKAQDNNRENSSMDSSPDEMGQCTNRWGEDVGEIQFLEDKLSEHFKKRTKADKDCMVNLASLGMNYLPNEPMENQDEHIRELFQENMKWIHQQSDNEADDLRSRIKVAKHQLAQQQ